MVPEKLSRIRAIKITKTIGIGRVALQILTQYIVVQIQIFKSSVVKEVQQLLEGYNQTDKRDSTLPPAGKSICTKGFIVKFTGKTLHCSRQIHLDPLWQ